MKCAILIRGQCFRGFLTNGVKIQTPSSIEIQKECMNRYLKLIEHLKNKFGLNVNLFIDTYKSDYDEYIKTEFSKIENSMITIHNNSEPCQMKSLDRSVQPIINSEYFEDYQFIMIFRFDAFLKDNFFEKFNPFVDTLLFPCVCWHKDRKIRNYDSKWETWLKEEPFDIPRVNDVFFLIPKKYNFLCKNFIMDKYYGSYSPHELIFIWNKIVKDLQYSFILNTYHDSNSSSDWNPLYYMIDRPQRPDMDSNKHLTYPEHF